VAGKVDGVGADAATDLQNLLTAPAFELGKSGDVRFHEIFAGLDFVEILSRADRLRGVTDVAGALVPVALDLVDGYFGKISH
jgi:hypothetical protein